MVAGSVANNVGLNARQLHLISVEKSADCRFVGFQLQVVTPSSSPKDAIKDNLKITLIMIIIIIM